MKGHEKALEAREGPMPLVSEFNGIKIYLYWQDHAPPRFHAEYGEARILVEIEGATVMRGAFPFPQLKLILAWCELHRDELMTDWQAAKIHGAIQRIAPLT